MGFITNLCLKYFYRWDVNDHSYQRLPSQKALVKNVCSSLPLQRFKDTILWWSPVDFITKRNGWPSKNQKQKIIPVFFRIAYRKKDFRDEVQSTSSGIWSYELAIILWWFPSSKGHGFWFFQLLRRVRRPHKSKALLAMVKASFNPTPCDHNLDTTRQNSRCWACLSNRSNTFLERTSRWSRTWLAALASDETATLQWGITASIQIQHMHVPI